MSKDHSQDDYRPRSPDLSAFAAPPPPPKLNRLPSIPQQTDVGFPPGFSFSHRGSYDASPYFSPSSSQAPSYFSNQPHQPSQVQSPQQYRAVLPPTSQGYPDFSQPFTDSPQRPSQQLPPGSQPNFGAPQPFINPYDDEMARLRNRKQVNYNDDRQDLDFEAPPPMAYPPQQPLFPAGMPNAQPMQPMQPMQMSQPPMPQQQVSPQVNVDVKTKFPVARIKRIMQADEDVGKVAQATPTAVSKALELFMIGLVTKGASEAKTQNSKRVTATHLKTALLNDPQFDFLKDICESVPDEGAKKGRAKSEAKSEDSDEDASARRKSKASTKRKKGDDSD